MSTVNDIIDGRFHLRATRGAGAWGELFVAEDKPKYGALAGGMAGNNASNGNGVVIELVSPEALTAGIKIDAVEREMKAFKGAGSPHLLACMECGRESKRQYLAMECWADSLEDRLTTTISVEELEPIAAAISKALAHLHDRGLHHAGVHPRRIVSVAGEWKLMPSGPSATSGPRIISPERKTGAAEDIYAFGITFLHALLIARGHTVPLDDLAAQHERWLMELPSTWRTTLGRCLQKEPKRRCTAHDLISAKAPPARPVLDLTDSQTGDGPAEEQKRRIEERTIAALDRRKRDLESEVNKLQGELQAARNNRVIRLGVFGVRGSGKSSLLAVWSLYCVDHSDPHRKMQLRFPDDDSLLYLKEVRAPILKEGKSHPTAMAEPKKILFEMVADEDGQREVWQIETMDFSGEFVELMADKTGVKSFAKQSHEFLKSADVVLCCHRWNDNSQETLEAINRVLAEYGSQFILALTRLDERGEVPRSKEDLENVLQELEQASPVYFGNLLANIQDICRRAGRVGIMAICPLGKNFSDPRHFPRGRELTVEDLQPIAIYEPLRSAVERKKQAEPRLQQRLQELQLELAKTSAELETANANRERQLRAHSDHLRAEVSELRKRVQPYLDQGEMPPPKIRQEVSHLAQKASGVGDTTLARECGDLLKAIGRVRERAEARRRRTIELAVLLAIALVLAVPVLWIVWHLLGRQN